MRPLSHPDRSDGFRLGDQPFPGVASRVDDGVIGFEDAVGKPVCAQIPPDVLGRVQLGRARGRKDRRDVFGDIEFARRMPSGAVEWPRLPLSDSVSSLQQG